MYESQVRQHQGALQRQRRKHAEAVQKAARLEQDIARASTQAQQARSESTARSHLRRVEGKQRELMRVRNDEAKAVSEIASLQAKLTAAEQKLAKARATEERRAADRAERERSQQERQAERERRDQERAARSAELARQQQERARKAEFDVLRHRTTDLEQKLAAAERRAAPPEITVLFLASSPEDRPALRLDQETREIQKQIRATDYRDSIWFEWRLARQVTDLIQDLNEIKPDVVHFSGHGSDEDLLFEDAGGRSVLLAGEQLQRLLQLGESRIRLAVFNTCSSASHADLARRHVDVAIGMDATISDEAAKTFAAQFYASLGFGVSVAEAFRQASLQVELVHGAAAGAPRLFPRDEVDPETIVLVNPDSHRANLAP